MVTQGEILLPVMALVFWTFLVLVSIAFRRLQALYKRQVTATDFTYGESSRVPVAALLANRNYMNLLELPVLFYLGCTLFFLLSAVTETVLVLAWFYVGLRIAHSVVHLSWNNVLHRFYLFVASNLTLLGIWLLLIGPVWQAGMAV
ncbi:MAG: MAPEG family protein [Marinobacterium sp.]|nr:MAPEG family protein [Marinobacterium sp.]